MFQVLGQPIVVDETQAIKDESDKTDMRCNTRKKYELHFPDFFFFLFIIIKWLVS